MSFTFVTHFVEMDVLSFRHIGCCFNERNVLVFSRYNNKTYRIDDVAFDQNPRCTFTFHTGEQMSYMDYYKYGFNTM